jgi:hypothetical protein
MRKSLLFIAALTLLGVIFTAPLVAQESKAVKTMAGILMTVNHFPNDEQKKTLQAVAADTATTAQEKVLIQALLTMQHSVTEAEKPKVQAVVKDQGASAGVRTIAGVLERFLHMASEADKATLKKLAT